MLNLILQFAITIFSLFSFGSGKQGTKEKQTLSRLLLIGQPGTWSVSGSEPLPSGPGLPGPDYIPAAKPSAAPGDCPPPRWSKGLPHSTPHRTVQPQRSVRTSSHCEQNQPREVRPSSVSCSAGYVRNWIATIYPRINAKAPPGTMAVQHSKNIHHFNFVFCQIHSLTSFCLTSTLYSNLCDRVKSFLESRGNYFQNLVNFPGA